MEPAPTGSQLSFRPEVSADSQGAIAWHGPGDHQPAIWFGAERSFELSYVGLTQDSRGKVAIAFEVAMQDKLLFGDFTESLTDRHMAILVDGEIKSAPNVMSRLPGSGILTGGVDGFEKGEAQALVTALRIG